MTTEHVHLEHESRPWTVRIPDHPRRTESKEFVAARVTMHKILDTLKVGPYDAA